MAYARLRWATRFAAGAVWVSLAATDAATEDWPRWRGANGNGTWKAPPLPEKWPAEGLRRVWRRPVGGGYSGVAAVGNRVYTMDRQTEPEEVERILCLDADSGELIWAHAYEVAYGDLDYGSGPRATPTIDDGRVYTLGSVGHLHCLDAATGEVIWSIDSMGEMKAGIPTWGFAASVPVWKDRVFVHIGVPGGSVVALDRRTGKEIWRSSEDPAGYCTPMIVSHKGSDRLIVWNPEHIVSMSPETGAIHWQVPYKVTNGVSITAPIFEEGILFVSGYWEGSKAIRLSADVNEGELIWEENRWLRGVMSQPLFREGYVYHLDKFHGLICFDLQTGERVWADDHKMTPKSRNPHASMVWIGEGDRALILNSDGDLILARLTPEGYDEQDRTNIIGHTWAHPAFAGNRVYARSQTEMVAVELPAKP